LQNLAKVLPFRAALKSNLWIMKYHKRVTCIWNTNMGQLSEPSVTFPIWEFFPFKNLFPTGFLRHFLFGKRCVQNSHNACPIYCFMIFPLSLTLSFNNPHLLHISVTILCSPNNP
jgi:hypothetical protein